MEMNRKIKIDLAEPVDLHSPGGDHEPSNPRSKKLGCKGVIEFIIKDRQGNVVANWHEPNIVKIPANEMLSHRLPSSQIWDPLAASGEGDWVDSGIDPTEEFAAR